MTTPQKRRVVCLDCSTNFRLTMNEMYRAGKARCPACGSPRWEKSGELLKTAGRDLAGINSHGEAKRGYANKSERAVVKSAKAQKRMRRLMSTEGAYRLTVIKNSHARLRAERARKKAEAEREGLTAFWGLEARHSKPRSRARGYKPSLPPHSPACAKHTHDSMDCTCGVAP